MAQVAGGEGVENTRILSDVISEWPLYRDCNAANSRRYLIEMQPIVGDI